VKNCVERHRKQGVPEAWLQQILDYFEHAMPLYPANFSTAIVSGDIHQYHLLVNLEHGRWRLSGLFDFDDARIGFYEYDLAAAGLFLMPGRQALLRPFLLTYGYIESELNEQLSRRLMAYTLLHPYRPLNWIREDLMKGVCSTFDELARVIYSVT
jgi:hygromycin-B 7''-O-kinase